MSTHDLIQWRHNGQVAEPLVDRLLRGEGEAGSVLTTARVMQDVAAITHSSNVNPDCLTIGPINHTAIELAPREIVSRMPETRDRMESSTNLMTIASVNGTAPKMVAMKTICAR